jgi:16S rRNA (uracil1498-N3)-methyltransferase
MKPIKNYINVLIGPEGGFTNQEFDTMEKYPFMRFVSLGDVILRSETAAISALSCIGAFLQATSTKEVK